MKMFKKILIGICSLACTLACAFGFLKLDDKLDVAAESAAIATRTLHVDNSAVKEYWLHNDTPIEEGKDFTIEFTVEEISKVSASGGVFAATGTTAKDWNYANVIASNTYFALFQNQATSVNLETGHYRYYFKYMTSGTNAGKYEMNRYVNGTRNYAAYKAYQPYMGLYFVNFNFDMTLTGIKCYEGTGSDAKDVGLYTEAKGVGFYMEDGASIRMSDPTGLGFTSRISYADYNEKVQTYGKDNVSTGTIIALTSDVSSLDSFTHATLKAQGVKYLDVKNKGFKNAETAATDGYYAWRGSIVNMYAHNLEKNFSSVGYVCVNGEYTYTVYNEADNSRNVRYVATNAYNDTNASQTDKHGNAIVDSAHPSVGQYSPYTAEQLQIISKYIVTFDDESSWWSVTPAGSNPLMTISATGNTSWLVGLTGSDAWGVFTLKAGTLQMLQSQGVTSVDIKLASKANQANAFYLYQADDISKTIGAANKSYTYSVDLTDEVVQNGVSFMLRAIDLSSNAAWGATEACDGFTMSMDLHTEFNEEVKATWLTYNNLGNGISYDAASESWQLDVTSGKILKIDGAAIAKYRAEGAYALTFKASSKANQATSFEFVGYPASNVSATFTVDITDEMCVDGFSVQSYYGNFGQAAEASDGYILSITPVTVLELPDKWFTYNGTTSGVTYENDTWTVTGAPTYDLKLDGKVVDDYLQKGIGALTYTIGWKDGKAASMSVQIPNSSDTLLSNTGSYNESNNSVAANSSITVTIKLTEKMARDGMSMTMYFYDRGWSGDTAGVDGFTISYTTVKNSALPENWIIGQDIDVSYDGTQYTLTATGSESLKTGFNNIAISKWLIDKMKDQGNTKLSFLATVSNPVDGRGVDFTVPDAASMTSYRTIEVNIEDLSANGDATSYYNPDGYFPLRFYVSNTNTKLYIQFDKTPAETYQVVYAKGADDTEIQAATMLAEHLEETTGVACEVVSDRYVTWSENAKYISVGQTSLLSDAGLANCAEENVSGDGYIRRSIGNTLFIDGITSRGTLYGVLDYLEDAYSYVFISDGIYDYTANPNLVVSDLDKDFTPTFDTRTYLGYGTFIVNTNATTALYYKANCYYLYEPLMQNYGGVNMLGYVGATDHNMYDTLVEGVALYNAAYGTTYNAEDFARGYTVNNVQNYNPCLSGGLSQNGLTALDFMTLAMKNCILSQYSSGVRYYSLTQEDDYTDNPSYCNCATCVEQANLYGRSGLMVNFFNQMIEKLDGDAEIQEKKATDYRLITFAYQYTIEAPKGGIVCDDKIVIRLAYAADDAKVGIAQNEKKYIEQWALVASELMYWGYDMDFRSYLCYFASTTGAMADNIKYLKDHKVSFVMMQGAHNANNIWHSQLRAYVYSKLMYDFDETAYANGADAYVQSLVTEYLKVYYGEYADEVQSVITYYQKAYASKAVNSSGDAPVAAMLEPTEHNAALNLIYDSYNNCADEVMKKRLAAVVASCYAGQYEATPIILRYTMQETLKEYCAAAGITQWNETKTVEEALS